MPPMTTKMTATSPLTAMMPFSMLMIIPGRASLEPLQPAASLTASAAFELQTSFAACAIGVILSKDNPRMLMMNMVIVLTIFDFM